MTTKARKLERKTRAAELDVEIMRAREANGLPVISPMLGLSPEKWQCGPCQVEQHRPVMVV